MVQELEVESAVGLDWLCSEGAGELEGNKQGDCSLAQGDRKGIPQLSKLGR